MSSVYSYPMPLRWADADIYGHINNALFLRYMEEARTRMFKDMLPDNDADRRRRAFVVSEAQITYRNPLEYSETPVDVQVRVLKCRGAKLDLGYEIRDTERIYAVATTMMAAYDLDTGRPRRISEDELAFLAAYVQE
ncbi:acyl-CoA thioesterase [Streptomyces acidiscabies]|uniref:Thioesterase family protein n=1 Tax=Streptomyces acidiscabies TaxID=42234 RepID=A0AAP6BGP2_9ACTN|nr:thioesterase family protein [Streptomyces acidiscabies]MBP5935377.1 acyl-CoA thioesterase [Streptomyces sp. LBUM 1476]MBZ3916776.1 acyl-CoA thioesterase [Streptomyces acidiscabies]MDX2964377.1 thioesterase family protein [Streptomyces acidiscabies]MDX3024912.1 thioesterase family protein [Streptomyces acidiscabies]MDX3794200.1 thioesterase family protein [Streptomyces acidiscabies]